MDFQFNANKMVKVKLTEYGIQILKDRRTELNERIKERGGQGLDEYVLKTDEEGYYRTQLWILMSEFGEHIQAGSQNPFDLNMVFEKGYPRNSDLTIGQKVHSIFSGQQELEVYDIHRVYSYLEDSSTLQFKLVVPGKPELKTAWLERSQIIPLKEEPK